MTYLGIDRNRLSFLLGYGASDIELRRFFTDCRTALIRHGAKVQNLPHGKVARLNAIAREFPPATDPDLRAWFSKHVSMVDPEPVGSLIEEFRLYEDHGENIPDAERARRLSRSCLVHMFAEQPPAELIAFLRTPIGPSVTPIVVEEARAPDQPLSQFDLSTTTALSKAIVALLEGRELDEELADVPRPLAAFMSALQAIHLRRMEDAESLRDAGELGSALREELDDFARRSERRAPTRPTPTEGLQFSVEQDFVGDFLLERDEVVGYCTTETAGVSFVRPLAVLRAKQVFMLNGADARRIFPESGDLIAFVGSSYPKQPARGEIGVWHVAEHATDKPTRFHLMSPQRQVFEVLPVPFFSSDVDSVRQYLIQLSSERVGPRPLQSRMFQLRDGRILAARADRPDLSREESFESGLRGWSNLQGLRLEGRTFVIGPLPPEQFLYDCGSLASALRALVRASNTSHLTRAQLKELSESLEGQETTVSAIRVARLRSELDRLADQADAVEAFVDEVAKRPEVASRVEEKVQFEVAKHLAEKTELRGQIDRLRKDRDEWESKVRKQKEEHKRLREETAGVVRLAFERARNENLPKLLADAAIFGALSPQSHASSGESTPIHKVATKDSRISLREITDSGHDPIAALRLFGVPKQTATAFVAVARAATRAGLFVLARGLVARPAIGAMTAAFEGRHAIIDVPLGLVDDSILRSDDLLADASDVLVLLDANLSAIDIYARVLMDRALTRIVSHDASEKTTACYMVLSTSVGALPVPEAVRRVAVMFDFDNRYRFESGLDLPNGENEEAEFGGLASLWPIAARRLVSELRDLDSENRGLALSLLRADIDEPAAA